MEGWGRTTDRKKGGLDRFMFYGSYARTDVGRIGIVSWVMTGRASMPPSHDIDDSGKLSSRHAKHCFDLTADYLSTLCSAP